MPFPRLIPLALLTAIVWTVVATPSARAQSSSDESALEVRAAFGGTSKAGRWTAVRVSSTNGDAWIRLTTQDGDGLTVNYAGRTGVWHYAKQGPVRESLLARAASPQGDELAVAEVEQRVLPSTDLLFVVFGDIGEFDTQVLRRVGLKRESFTLDFFQDPSDVPDHWIGFDAIDTLVVTTRDLDRINRLSPDQIAAIRLWVEMGGRLLLSAGASGSQLLSATGPFADLVPGKFEAVSQVRSTSGLEAYASATERLKPMAAVELSDIVGRVLVHDGVGARRDQPLVVEAPFGLGQVVLIAFDLDDPAIVAWQGKDQLLGKLLVGERQEVDEPRDDSRSRRVTHFGYDDITGQLRAALDQFRGLRVVAFSAVAGLISLYILLIGPGDYFFLKRVVRRMIWSWLTFPLLAIAFSIVTIALVAALRGERARINQVDLVDIDVQRSIVRATSWAHIYSPSAKAYGLELESAIPGVDHVDDSLLSWQGLPGKGLGGLNATTSGSLFPAASYTIESSGRDGMTFLIDGYPLRASSTASLVGRIAGTMRPLEFASLHESGTAHLLAGTLENPLPFPLKDSALLYGEWTYLMNGDLLPGQRVNIERELIPKTLSWRLTRRRIVDTRDVSTPWEPTATDDVPRIIEMLMFHEAAGGVSYTRLSHRHQSNLDLSEQLRLGRAILVGRSDEAATRIVPADESTLAADRQYTFYRFVIPVQPRSTGDNSQ